MGTERHSVEVTCNGCHSVHRLYFTGDVPRAVTVSCSECGGPLGEGLDLAALLGSGSRKRT